MRLASILGFLTGIALGSLQDPNQVFHSLRGIFPGGCHFNRSAFASPQSHDRKDAACIGHATIATQFNARLVLTSGGHDGMAGPGMDAMRIRDDRRSYDGIFHRTSLSRSEFGEQIENLLHIFRLAREGHEVLVLGDTRNPTHQLQVLVGLVRRANNRDKDMHWLAV